ncbi:hypothetical protein SH528x_005202 [Novipirellula sp. SH528]|uniref:hypothetical protein n=1 Tax=Novipirellula sp. SH528 TaxID=3454466 RepID=UPI003FA04A65
MKTNAKKTAMMIMIIFSLASSTGCVSGRLPWLANEQEPLPMDSYVAQAVSNIQYETDVDFAQDYETAASYTVADTRTAARPSVGSSDSCSSGCCE